jgi:hypothetical protein
MLMRVAAERHRQAEQIEESFGDGIHAGVDGRAIGLDERGVDALDASGALDRQLRIVQPHDLAGGKEARCDPAVGQRCPETVQVARVRIRQRPEHHRVDGAEDGRGGAHAEGQGGYSGQREGRSPAQASQGETQVLEQGAHRDWLQGVYESTSWSRSADR